MYWTRSDLARLAYSQACRELGDSARAQVPTVHDGWLRACELLADALRLRADAEQVVELAIAFERVKGASWREIADVLELSSPTARERYAPVVDDIRDAILFACREGRDGAPGCWACPPGVEDPDTTARALDAWVARHREPTDPERGDSPVSDGLRPGTDARVLDALGRSLELATRLINRTLPTGIGERTARRMLLEAKVTAYDLIAERERGDRARDGRHAATDALEQLTAWHRGDLRKRLGHIATNDCEAVITLDGRPLALLTLSGEEADEDARGSYLWWLGKSTNVPARPAATTGTAWRAAVSRPCRRRRRARRRRRQRRRRGDRPRAGCRLRARRHRRRQRRQAVRR